MIDKVDAYNASRAEGQPYKLARNEKYPALEPLDILERMKKQRLDLEEKERKKGRRLLSNIPEENE